jgi:cell wall-associated NlpC family hydrolase
LRNEIVTYAQKFVGNPYVWGGESLTRGADCSGFVQAIYADFGYHIPRVSGDQASSAGQKVSVSDLLPGDLIFYTNSSGNVNHVAMYIGNGMIVHAANSRQGIIRSKYNYRDIYCARRIVN